MTEPGANPRFALFDSLRGIAVLCIIAYHVASITGELNRPVLGDLFAVLGNQALIFFFVISGFLLYRPFVAARAGNRRPPRVRRYARRRALRILPAYWVALTVLAIFPGLAFPGGPGRYYLFTQAYSDRTIGGGIPPAWSLCVEVLFYLSLPVWAVALGRLGSARRPDSALTWWRVELTALSALGALGIVVQVAASRLWVSSLLATTLLGECVWLALGMSLAVISVAAEREDAFRRLRAWVTRNPSILWALALACLVGATAVLQPGGLFNIIVSLRTRQPYLRTLAGVALTAGLSATLVGPAIFGEQAGGLPRRVLAWRPLALLGLVSYGVYLYHLTVAELIGLGHDPGHFSAAGLDLAGRLHTATTPVLYLATVAGSVLLATVSYRLVERPFLRLKEAPSRPGRSPSGAA